MAASHPTGSSQRDAQRRYRDDLVDAGLDLLLTESIGALRALLNVSAVHRRTDELGKAVPRASAYRAVAPAAEADSASATDELVRAVATEAADRDRSGSAVAHRSMVEAFATRLGAAGNDEAVQEQLIETLQINLEVTLANDGLPATWLLHAAAMTGGPAWAGTRPLRGADAELAEDILAVRRAQYEQVTADLAPLMEAGLSALRRRPRPGMTPEMLVKLMHTVLDGAVMRLTMDADAFDTRVVAEAMYRLGLAFTEEGAYCDPRRGHGDQAVIFDRMVDAASGKWRDDPHVGVAGVAAEIGIDHDAAATVFPSDADLADSLVRSMVMSGGPAPDVTSTVDATQLAAMLWHLADAADTHPHAVRLAARDERRLAASITADLRSYATQLVRSSFPDDAPAATAATQTADTLVSVALEGKQAWRHIVPLLRLLGVPTDETTDETVD